MKKILLIIDDTILRIIVNWLYPQYIRPRYGYSLNRRILIKFVFMQKILKINHKIPWPVDFRSKINGWENIEKGIMCDPGDMPGCYIQATNGIKFGSNIEIGPGVKIISSNHIENDYSKAKKADKIIIGNNVWIGSNSVILPEVKIGNNVIIGAGSIVTKNIPNNSIAFGNPCIVVRKKEKYVIDISIIKLNRKTIMY